MKTLHLTLKKKWWDMTYSGEKPEDYRDLTEYWASRLLYKIEVPCGGYWSAWKDIKDGDYTFESWNKFTGGAPVFNSFDQVFARNGYNPEKNPAWTRRWLETSIGYGQEKWGAEPGKKYFVIKLGEKINEHPKG